MELQNTSYSTGHEGIPKKQLSSFTLRWHINKNKNVTFGKHFQRTLIWTDIKRTDFISTDIKMNVRTFSVRLISAQIKSDKVYR